MGKPEGKGPLGRPRHRWDNNKSRIFRKWDWGGGTWTGFVLPRIGDRWQALVNAVINLWVP